MSSVCPKLIYSYILWKNCKNLNRKPIDLSAPNVEIQPIRLQFTLRIAVHETSVGEHHIWKMKCHGWRFQLLCLGPCLNTITVENEG